MNRIKIRNYQIFSIIFTFILGSLLHFLYKLSGENQFIAVFSSINESVWEHLKLLYFPMLLTIIIGYFYIGKELDNFLCAKTIGIIISILFIITFFYTYTGILGKHIAFIDISSFFVATVLGELTSYILIINKFKCNNIISLIILIILLMCFIFFTYLIPDLGIFREPVASGICIKN